MKDRITKGAATAAPAPFRRPNGRASFPRRKTIDLTDEQNTWLNQQAYDGRVSAAGIVRSALSYLADHPDALDEVLAAVHAIEHPDVAN